MSSPIEVSAVTQDEGVQRLLTALETALSDERLAVWMNSEARDYVDRQTRERFSGEGDRVSGHWAPLADSTKADRLAKGFPEGPILHRTGALEDYIVGNAQVAMFPGGAVMNAPGPTTDPEMQMKVQVAQEGTKNMPARPVIGMDTTDAIALTELLNVSLHTEIGKLL